MKINSTFWRYYKMIFPIIGCLMMWNVCLAQNDKWTIETYDGTGPVTFTYCAAESLYYVKFSQTSEYAYMNGGKLIIKKNNDIYTYTSLTAVSGEYDLSFYNWGSPNFYHVNTTEELYFKINSAGTTLKAEKTAPNCGPSVSFTLTPAVDFSVCWGGGAPFQIKAENVELQNSTNYTGPTYKWFKNGEEISGATLSSLTTTTNTDAIYKCRVTYHDIDENKDYTKEITRHVYVESAEPLEIDNISGCPGSEAYVTLPDLDKPIYYKTTEYSTGTSVPSHTTNHRWGNFPGSSSSNTRCYAIKSTYPTELRFCREKCITKTGIEDLYIATQPLNTQNVCKSAAPADLTVVPSLCSGEGTYTYQWYSNTTRSTTGATAISGATNATYTPPTSTVGTMYYFCKVTEGGNTMNSSISTVTVFDSPAAPIIADASVPNCGKFKVPVNAEYKCETSSLLNSWTEKAAGTEIGTLYNDPGLYVFKARNVNVAGCHSEEVSFYVRSLYDVGEITERKVFENQTVCHYGEASMWSLQGASQWGTNNLTYTWKKGTTNTIGEAENVGFTKSFTPSTDDAVGTYYYWCVIGYTGQSATYTVGPKTVTIQGPSDMNLSDVAVCPGTDIEFTSDADVSGYTITAKRGNGTTQAISGSEKTVTISSTNITQAENTTETYTITASYNGCPISEDVDVTIFENAAVNITNVAMDSISACTNEEIPTLEVLGDCCAGPVTYQWYKNTKRSTEGAIPVSGATSATYTPTRAEVDTCYYYCVATRAGREAVSKITRVSIYQVPSVTFSSDKTNFYCSEEVGVTVAETFPRYEWGIITGATSTTTKITTNNENSIPLDCGASSQPDHVYVTITDKNQCSVTESIAITVNALNNVYYYLGPNGENSMLNDPDYWYTCDIITMGVGNGQNYHNSQSKSKAQLESYANSHSECVKLNNNFISDGCKYIINQDDVELREEQTWTISGAGSKLAIGDGYWTNVLTSISSSDVTTLTASTGTASYDYRATETPSGITGFSLFMGPDFHTNKDSILARVARYDFRDYAKSFKVSGILNLQDNITMDVLCGSSVEIATDAGSPTLGTLSTQYLTSYDPAKKTTGNVQLIPGSIVTYSGNGTKAIQSHEYSNVYINNSNPANVVFPTLMEVKQRLVFDDKTKSYSAYYGPNSGTIIYSGEIDQIIPRMTYNNIETQIASVKKIEEGSLPFIVSGKLSVGTASKLNASDADIYLTDVEGSGKVFSCDGVFVPGTSTVHYANCTVDELVAAVNYYNLDLKASCANNAPNRTFAHDGTAIGIAGDFYPGDAVVNIDKSTVEFNGTGRQVCPDFTFYNLNINNSAILSNTGDVNPELAVQMQSGATVRNKLSFTKGILNTGEESLTVLNTAIDAVGPGYYKDYKDASFLVGNLTRTLPANMDGSDLTKNYLFSVGNEVGYNPLTITSVSTLSGTPTVTVSSIHGSVAPSEYTAPLSSVGDDIYWKVAGNSFVSSSVSLSESNGLSGGNCIAFSTTTNGTFSSLNGTVGTNSIERSAISGSGYYAIGVQTPPEPKTYYYNCSGGKDITDVKSWSTGRNGIGTKATSFYEDYAEWVIECNATVETKPLNITGSGSKVVLTEGTKLTMKNSGVFSILEFGDYSSVEVGEYGVEEDEQPYFTVLSSCTPGTGSVIKNYGVTNFYVGSLAMGTSTIENHGEMNFYETDLSLLGTNNNKISNSHYLNYGTVNMTNSSLHVKGQYAQLLNADGSMWVIDNYASSYSKSVFFDKCEFLLDDPNAFVSLDCGSTFYVKNSNVILNYFGNLNSTAHIDGNFIVENGNLSVRKDGDGGGTFSIEQHCGKMYIIDTDGSGDDGLLTLSPANGGGGTFNVGGVLYATGIVGGKGSGDSFNIKDGGFVFIGNLGATTPAYQWQYAINVESGGVLHYCGNRTATSDLVGTVMLNGDLFYASNYYQNGESNPDSEGDFVTDGRIHPLYTTMMECVGAFETGYTKGATSLLPIELTLLYGICIDENKVELRWQTASETNNNYFTILRSFDGITFEEIAVVDGAGTTTEVHNYVYYDTDEKEGVVYYKLRQTDFDGNTTESKVIAVQTCGKNAHFKIKQDEIEVFFRNPQANYVVITSVTGQIFYSKKFTNVEEARIAVPQRKGIYIISVIDSKQITSEKFIR